MSGPPVSTAEETGQSVEKVETAKAGKKRRWEQFLVPIIFIGALGAILYFTLVPNRHQDLFDVLPDPVRIWLSDHDNLGNILAFFVFGILTFRTARVFGGKGWRVAGQNSFRTTLEEWSLTILLTMVCLIEIVQMGIPGRDGSLHDVITGWTGILVAWWIRRRLP